MKPFFLLILAIPLLAQAYISWHVYRLLPFPTLWKVVAVALMTAAFISFFLVFLLRDSGPIWLNTIFYEVGTSWLIILLYASAIVLVADLARLVRLLPPHILNNSLLGTALIIGSLIAVFSYGAWRYHNKVRTTLQLTTPSGKTLDKPLTIVMMSDLHLGYHNRRAELARWVNIINDEHPDLVLIAGDIIDSSVRPLLHDNMAAELRRIQAPVIACLGNHEYYASTPAARQFLNDAGITLLVDSTTTVAGVTVIGRDDRTNPNRRPLQALVNQADTSLYTILLDHQPHNLDQARRCGIDLQLSGHTHHGQVWPANWITDAIFEVAYGFKQKDSTAVYVSSGIGIWGGKFRIGTVSEYVVINLAAPPAID